MFLIDAINAVVRVLVAVVVGAVGVLPDGLGLLALSVVLSLLVLVVFRYASNQKAIQRARDRVQAHLMELRLFPDDPRTTLKSIGQLMVWNVRYIGASLRPAVVLSIPLVLVLGQLDHHFGAEPIPPGGAATVTARLTDAVDPRAVDPQLVGSGVVVETPAVRSQTDRLVSWRVRGVDSQRASVRLSVAGEEVKKSVAVGSERTYLSPRRTASALSSFVHSGEPVLRSDAVEWIEVAYPAASVRVLGWDLHWLTIVLLGMLVGVLALRRPLGVEV